MPYYTYDSNLRDRNMFTSTVQTTHGVRRYFSSLDTEVYFGSKLMDEVVAIDFVIAEPKLPIYGFNSFYANRIVAGRRTIQGTFAINFTHTLDLLNVLNSIEDSILKAEFPTANGESLDYESLTFRCEGEDSTGLGIGNSAIFRKMFDITLSYGYAKTDGMQTYNCSYQTLVGVQIVDYRQALDTEGNPILDMYSFIAKDLRFQDALSGTNNETSKETSSSNDANGSQWKRERSPKDENEYLIANKRNNEEYTNLIESCKNSDIVGFIVEPTFNYSSSGSYAASAYPYLRLNIDSENNQTDKFTDVMITIEGYNISIPLKDVKRGGFILHEFKDSTRDLGIALRKKFIEKDNYKAKCEIEFVATVKGEKITVKTNTEIYLGSVN